MSEYLKSVYEKKSVPTESSLFARFCRDYLQDVRTVVEAGSGNGRDAYFWGETCKVQAYDPACKPEDTDNVRFLQQTMEEMEGRFDLLYSRFSLHSVPEDIEDRLLNYAKQNCKYVAIECRTLKDSIAEGLNEKNATTYADAHYRRYLNYETFVHKLKSMGFKILFAGESDTYAPYKEYKPWCLRVIAKRTKTVITFGTFDLFHVGHLNLLQRARKLGDCLIVGVSSDALNMRKKKRTPIVSEKDRMAILRELKCVDKVFLEESLELKRKYIEIYNADILTMGNDWEGKFDGLADEVIYLDRTPCVSTTATIETIKKK